PERPAPGAVPKPEAALRPRPQPAPAGAKHAKAETATGERAKPKKAPATGTDPLRRRANVRWFKRMNPQRMYPLTVVLAKGRVKEVKVKGVAQAVSAEQLVVTADNPFITVRPVLPGVKVYPPEQTVDVTPDLVSVRFHVLPQTMGEVPDARIEFYWRQRLISQVDLPMEVRRQTAAIIASFAGLVW